MESRRADSTTTLQVLKDEVQAFIDEREWRQFHDPKNLSMSIAIEAAELMEHFQWLQKGHLAELRKDVGVMHEIGEEVADIFCYLISFANAMEIDLSSTLQAKMIKNAAKYPANTYRGRF